MNILIHPSAIEQNPDILQTFDHYRIAPRGTPLTKQDHLIVGWNVRFAAAWALRNKPHTLEILVPNGQIYTPCVPGLRWQRVEGSVVLKSCLRDMQDRGCKLYKTMPANWTGTTWFSMREIKDLAVAANLGRISSDVLTQNHATHACCAPFIRSNMLWNRGRAPLGTHVVLPLRRESIRFNLLECLEIMPPNASVQVTIKDMPFDYVPRKYLLWLVCDGEFRFKKDGLVTEGQMTTAVETQGDKPNHLRESILHHLETTGTYRVECGKLVNPEWASPRGDFLAQTPEAILRIKSQCEKMDFETRDLETAFFSTFSYMENDKVIDAGTSIKIPFGAHGMPSWIKTKKTGNRSSEMPSHVLHGLSDYERTEKWIPAEEENYDWKPAPFSKLDLEEKHSRSLDSARLPYGKVFTIEWLFQLHTRLDIWVERDDYLFTASNLEMNKKDRDEMDWELREHALDLHRIKEEYLGVFSVLGSDMPREWGLKEKIQKAEMRQTKRQEPEDEVLEYLESEGRELVLEPAAPESAPESAPEREWSEALSWREVEKLRLRGSRGVRMSLKFAMTQAPCGDLEKRSLFA
jgi:hypothetical protein